MLKKNYENDEDYILEILEDEEERVFDKLVEVLPRETRHLFFRYLSVINTINKMKTKK
jgi:hypothetical protein